MPSYYDWMSWATTVVLIAWCWFQGDQIFALRKRVQELENERD